MNLIDFPAIIVKWAEAIGRWEGAEPQSCNMGNLKYTSLTRSWGAMQGRPAADGGYFCDFATPLAGELALCNFLLLGCEDLLIAFHEARTLGAFTKVFAGNPPQGYIDGISEDLGVPEDTLISTFLQTN